MSVAISRDSDFGRNLARRIRDLDVEIATLELARDQVAGVIDDMDARLHEQKRHRADLLTRQDGLLP